MTGEIAFDFEDGCTKFTDKMVDFVLFIKVAFEDFSGMKDGAAFITVEFELKKWKNDN